MSRTDVRRGGTEGAVRLPDRGAGVSRGHSRPCSRGSHLGTPTPKGGATDQPSRERAAEGPNDGGGQ